MALENLTLFELHLENSRIGPSFGRGEEGEAPEEAGSSGGPRRGLAVGALLLLVVAAVVGFRRYRGGGSEETEQITIEHAAEQ